MLLKKSFISTCTILMLIPLISTNATEATLKAASLPEPLTLDVALSLIEQQHPDLRYIEAGLKNAQSNLQQTLSNNDLNISVKADVRWIEPSVLSTNQKQEDHRLGLYVNKTLYDFGRSSAQVDVASQQIINKSLQYINAQQRQYINVMKRYFDVVLADLQFYRYNEEMAVAYIQFDRIQIRKKLGQYTETDVAEKDLEYKRIRRLRSHSQNQQRVTRSLLAQALNRPNSLPSTVEKPELDVISRKLPDIEELQKKVKENNPVLGALRAKLAAAKNNIRFAYASDNPTLTGGFEAFSYERETSASNKWQATITLDVPLWSGDRVDAAVAKAKAKVYKIKAELAQQELAAQQQVLELWLGIETLKIKYDEVVAGMDFTELSLDKSRALYELEVTSDLGYSMVRFSEAERKVVQTDFDIALAWAQLDALSGKLLNKLVEISIKNKEPLL
ncbi:MAG: TolC family protein [Gammaproteobacteria bacterium]|nr:TolC family protein [Gammaproteobacteria bacterium]